MLKSKVLDVSDKYQKVVLNFIKNTEYGPAQPYTILKQHPAWTNKVLEQIRKEAPYRVEKSLYYSRRLGREGYMCQSFLVKNKPLFYFIEFFRRIYQRRIK